MFIIILTYTKPLEMVDQFVGIHRQHLDQYYQEKLLLASGPQEPRTGGIILAMMNDRAQVQQFIEADPYYINNVATYEVIEFNPVKHQPEIEKFFKHS